MVTRDPFTCRRYRVGFDGSIKQTYELFTRYEVKNKRGLGKGSYGYVCEAVDTVGGEGVAVKKLVNVFEDGGRTKSCLREVKLLTHFSRHTERGEGVVGHHDNILRIRDIMIPIGNLEESTEPVSERISNFQTVYIVTDLYDMSLRQLIDNVEELAQWYRAKFIYQILRGVYAVHSAGCIHRDLKPDNLLVQVSNESYHLCICDFGSGRDFDPNHPDSLTNANLVTSQWYRAPEVLNSAAKSTARSLDVWSIGCIWAELFSLEPIFKAVSPVSQLIKIQDLRGKLHAFLSSKTSDCTEEELDLLDKMLREDSAERITVSEALDHPFFQVTYREFVDGSPPETRRFTQDTPVGSERQAIWEDSLEYQPGIKQYLREHGLPLELVETEEG